MPGLPPWTVPRPRLEKRIAHGTQGPLTSITGPPGAGKTVAAASWAAGHGLGPVAWVTLDEFDNGPEVFWSYVLAALRQTGLARGPRGRSARARSRRRAHLPAADRGRAGRPPPAGHADPGRVPPRHRPQAVTAGLAYLLKNAQPGLRLVGVSRADPPLPLHQYRLTGDLTELRADDLAFTRAGGCRDDDPATAWPCRAASLATLTERSEGWAAGLRMAAMSMAGSPGPGAVREEPRRGRQRDPGYLVEEVLDTRPPEVRKLLLLHEHPRAGQRGHRRGAHLGSGPVARRWTPWPGRTRSCSRSGRAGTATTTVFRAVLAPEAAAREARRSWRTCTGGRPAWYQQNGMLADAVWHATKAGRPQLAARIMTDGLAIGQFIGPGAR